jgi:DNA-binding MarR family transcriptional regulator
MLDTKIVSFEAAAQGIAQRDLAREATLVERARKRTVRVAAARKSEAPGEVHLGYLSTFLGFHLRLAQDASYRVFSRQSDKELVKPGRFPALAIIHLNPGISQSALGRAIARDKSTVSPLIKDLQKSGFISRKPSAMDRRSVTLSLTKKGERTLDRLRTRAKEHEAELDAIIGTSKSRLMSLLNKIIEGMAE